MKEAILVDVDGTVAIMRDRSPFDYDMVGHDSINFPVWECISSLERTKGYTIIFCSGRENVEFPGKSTNGKYFRRAYLPTDGFDKEYPTCFDLTLAWLDYYCAIYNMGRYPTLYMREAGDNRPDYMVKKELYYNLISKEFDVKLVFDDRQQVVDMWRSIGLTCFQVAEGNF